MSERAGRRIEMFGFKGQGKIHPSGNTVCSGFKGGSHDREAALCPRTESISSEIELLHVW